MDDVYRYPVYFECRSLDEDLKKKIQLYFRNHRRSGGGECGAVRRLTGTVYCLAFQRLKDQQEVLQRCKHEVAGCSLLLTESDSSYSPTTSTSSPEYKQSSESVPASVLQPSIREQELQPATFPHEAEAEVIVGKHSPVQSNIDTDKGTHSSEKQTYNMHLDEAKLCLLRKDINHRLAQELPGLKVSQVESGQLVLEGDVREILLAKVCISDMQKLVLEKTVSDMSPHLLTFLKKAYKDPEVLRASVLGDGDEVVLEIRDAHLGLFSLSADNLDQAEKALQRELKEVKLDVATCSAAPSELWEKLKSKTNEMNQGQCRVQAVFISDNTVCLLGHSKEVDELSDMVTQFILDESCLEGTYPLPPSVPAEELPELLEKYGFDYLGVTFHPLPSCSEHKVALKGPSKKVFEVRNRLGPFLDSLPQKIPAVGSTQINSFPSICSLDQNQLIIPPLANQTLSKENPVVSSYSLYNGLQVLVCQGDITRLEADVLVNAANEDLDHCGGVAAALSKAGGPEVQKESKALVKQTGKIPTGEVVVTTGGNLKCKKLLHAVGPRGWKGGRERSLLETTVRSALKIAETMEFRSIAIPCISSGVFGVPIPVCSEAIVTAVKEFGRHGDRSLRKIILIDNREEVVEALQEACDRILQGKGTRNTTHVELKIDDAVPDLGATAEAHEGGVHIEITEGTIETQQVDALVSPMVGHDPLSTRVGNSLFKILGQQLTARFRKEAEEETMPGDAVLVEDLGGLPSTAVFFLNLVGWDEDPEGTAVEVLKVAVNNLLTSCERRGFSSVALPVLGSGIALRFPDSVVAEVLLRQIHAFQQHRVSRTPFLVRITIHPNNREICEVFNSVQEALTQEVDQPDEVCPMSTTKRIILLGKTGVGKSSLANVIFGEEVFDTDDSPNSGTKKCEAVTRDVGERSLTLIDTPGLFDAERSEEEVKPEILSCITECSPGPHAFLILLKVDKFTKQENDVIEKICSYFSEDALKYAVVVFTHGEQLPEGMKIQNFVRQNKKLSDLVEKCGGRCHVVDNTYWNDKQQKGYRSNEFQVEELLNTVDKMVMENSGGYYTNEVLQVVEEELKKEEDLIKTSSKNLSAVEIRKQAKSQVWDRFWIQMAATSTGVLLGAFLGVEAMVTAFIRTVRQLKSLPLAGQLLTGAAAGEVVLATNVVLGTAAGVAGAVMGGIAGHEAGQEAETIQEAIQMASKAVMMKKDSTLKSITFTP